MCCPIWTWRRTSGCRCCCCSGPTRSGWRRCWRPWASALGLGERLPQALSGGQLQRVAIARALVHQPCLLLADEPTGNLDPATAARVMAVLRDRARGTGAALVLVTHSEAAAAQADRVLHLRSDGIAE